MKRWPNALFFISFSLFFFFLEDALVDGPVIILYSVASREEKAWREKKKQKRGNAGGKAEKTSMGREGEEIVLPSGYEWGGEEKE